MSLVRQRVHRFLKNRLDPLVWSLHHANPTQQAEVQVTHVEGEGMGQATDRDNRGDGGSGGIEPIGGRGGHGRGRGGGRGGGRGRGSILAQITGEADMESAPPLALAQPRILPRPGVPAGTSNAELRRGAPPTQLKPQHQAGQAGQPKVGSPPLLCG